MEAEILRKQLSELEQDNPCAIPDMFEALVDVLRKSLGELEQYSAVSCSCATASVPTVPLRKLADDSVCPKSASSLPEDTSAARPSSAQYGELASDIVLPFVDA